MTPDQLKCRREELKVTFVELAALTGLPSEYIRKIMDEEVIPLTKDLIRIERAFGKIENEAREREGGFDGGELARP